MLYRSNNTSKEHLITEGDLKGIIKMVKGNLESFAEYFGSVLTDENNIELNYNRVINLSEDPKGNIRLQAAEKLKKAAKEIENKFTELFKGDEMTDVEELIKNTVLNALKEIIRDRDPEDVYALTFVKISSLYKRDEYFYNFIIRNKNYGNYMGLKESENNVTDEEYKATAKYKFTTKPLEGIKNIPEFDPATDTVLTMNTAREGNSETFYKTGTDINEALEIAEKIFKKEEANYLKNIAEKKQELLNIEKVLDEKNKQYEEGTELRKTLDAKLTEITTKFNSTPDNNSKKAELKKEMEEINKALKEKTKEVHLLFLDLNIDRKDANQIIALKESINKLEQSYIESKKNLEIAKYSGYAFISAADVSKAHAIKLMRKEEKISIEDLFDAFSEINECVRLGIGSGGKLRGRGVQFGKEPKRIEAIGPDKISLFLYRTLDTIATAFNELKSSKVTAETGDTDKLALIKTNAIELASYTYSMLITEHVFDDGNGRSCRLFADTILQAFGLPPHIPQQDETTLAKDWTKKKSCDFWKGTELFYKGVQQAGEQVRKDKENQKKLLERENNIYYNLTDTKLKGFKENAKGAKDCEGTFHDSEKYSTFEKCLITKYELCKLLYKAEKAGGSVNLNSLSKNSKGIVIILSNEKIKENNIPKWKCVDLLNKLDHKIEEAAGLYIRYKYKNHTDDKKKEPGKKSLNKDDRQKLDFIEKILTKERFAEIKKANIDFARNADDQKIPDAKKQHDLKNNVTVLS